ncbi:MAG: hypothetical protein ABSD10_03725 [Candidatus Saccharimonadales bacterium]|jgi:hypothetical protein
MPKLEISSKYKQINKAQSAMLATVTIASVVIIFCLMSAKALLSQAAYQRNVINANHVAVKQLQTNVSAAKQLVNQYNSVFEGSSTTNVIGGKNDTSANAVPPNGDNGRIVLDALPSNYDFPALLSSVSKILSNDGVANSSVGGTDQSATIDNNPTANPQPIQIQLTVAGTSSYSGVQSFIKDLERSIRPFDVTALQLSGPQGQLTFTLTVNSYFQPAKSLSLTTKVIH